MKPRLILFLLFCFGVGSYNAYNYFTGWKWAFKQSPSLVFYSLHPGPTGAESGLVYERNFSGAVLDKVVVSDPAEKEQLIAAAEQATTLTGRSSMASCFNPRQAISTPDRKTIVLLCFECGQVSVRTPRGVHEDFINRGAKPLFDSLVRKYGLKTDPAN